MNTTENLEKSINSLIDDLFAEESLEKAEMDAKNAIAEKAPAKGKPMGADQKPDMTADENGAEEEGEEDEKAGKKRGRPADLSQMSMRKENGESTGSYDASITEASKAPEKMKKSFEVSPEDFELLQKAKAAQKDEELRKAQETQMTLIKSVVAQATESFRSENEQLKKSLTETQELLKSLAKKPQPRKSISSIQVMEKSFGGENGPSGSAPESFSKAEMLDVAEALVKSKQLTMDHVIELENNGYIYDDGARRTLESAMKRGNR